MLICKLNAMAAKTALTNLLTTAGRTFNDKSTGITIQMDSAVSGETVDVMDVDTTDAVGEGITLTNDNPLQPSSCTFRAAQISEIYLKASADNTAVKVAIEHSAL